MAFRDEVAGEYRAALVALRDLLAERLEGAEPRESAPLARQLAEVLARLEGLPSVEVSKFDDLAARRAQRRAEVQDGTGGG